MEAEFRVLGPLEVVEPGGVLPLGGPRQRALLALLLLRRNEIVSTDRLIDALWGESPPESVQTMLQVYVSRLRKLLGRERLETRPPGYVLRVAAAELDLDRFEALTADGRDRLTRGDAAGAGAALREALRLWRGPALADLAYEPFARAEIVRLDEARLAALEDRIEADLALGRQGSLVGELEALVSEHPLRERLRGQLMLALYRCGRQAEALEFYRSTREALSQDLGIEPGRALQQLERAILNQDPALGLPEPVAPPPEERAEHTCPACGTAVSADSLFCLRCGARIALREPALEERKLVTVLFADLTGSTELGERLDPESLRALLGEYFDAMRQVVSAWGGTVEKFIGDAIMAVFGVPGTHEDDAVRALRAAVEMQERLSELNPTLARRHGVELRLRIGVEAGEVVAAHGRELIVTGDAANAAARLQEIAEPGQVVVGDRARSLARHAFRFESLTARPLKGKTRRLRLWRVIAPLPAPRRESRFAHRFVGRARELDFLVSVFQASLEERHPRLVAVVGDAGVGKSRLVAELVALLDGQEEPPRVLRGRCLSYGRGITYWALREVLWEAAEIRLRDAAATAAEKLSSLTAAALARQGPAEIQRVAYALAATAGIAIPGNPLEQAAPQSVGEELALAWPRLLSGLAAERPLVLVVEDLHWAEPPLLDMVEHIASRTEGSILVVATARPELAEARPGWSVKPWASQLPLEPLPATDRAALAAELLPGASDQLRERVLAAAEGNPFFAEEIVGHLLDTRTLARGAGGFVELQAAGDADIPDTVRVLLAARLDALPAAEKRTLQAAAVVGRVFWIGALAPLLGEVEARGTLPALEEKALVVVRPGSTLPGDTELTFRHGLVREVAYQSLPRAERARAHAAFARWVEELAGDRRDEFVELLAHHYESAASPEAAKLAWPDDPVSGEEARTKAVAALLEAGRAATRRFATDAGADYAARALALAASDADRLGALELRAEAAHAAVRADDAWAAYVEALELAERSGDREAAARLRSRATLLWSRYGGALAGGDWKAAAREIVERGLAEAAEEADTFELGCLLVGRGASEFWLGEPASDGQRRDLERAIEIGEAIGSLELASYAVDALAMMVIERGLAGAEETADRSLRLARAMESRVEAHEIVVTAARLYADAGRFAEASAAAAEAAEQARSLAPHHRIHAASAQVRVFVRTGELESLSQATAEVPALVRLDGGRTCLHGVAALAGCALARFEAGEEEQGREVIRLLDEAGPHDATAAPELALSAELVLPFVGVGEAAVRLRSVPGSGSVAAAVASARARLRLAALEGGAEFDGALAEARSLAQASSSPVLVWIADWAEAVRLARGGEAGRALEHAQEAAAALETFGERYTALRLLADLVPFLEGRDAARLRAEVAERFAGIGARASAAAL